MRQQVDETCEVSRLDWKGSSWPAYVLHFEDMLSIGNPSVRASYCFAVNYTVSHCFEYTPILERN